MTHDDATPLEQLGVTGTMVAYHFICRRKLWLYSKGLNLENVSGNVDVIKGKILHESRFKRESHKEFAFDTVKIDFLRFGDHVFVHEVKKSKKFEKAHIWQLKYYIYLLRKRGVNCSSGVIHYPASMRKVEVTWEEDDNLRMEQALKDVNQTVGEPVPPATLNKKMCSRCAYFDFCYA
ncbi:MAG: CRISPR-associated protein Cas4 [Syntrophothermaceae bacterium]